MLFGLQSYKKNPEIPRNNKKIGNICAFYLALSKNHSTFAPKFAPQTSLRGRLGVGNDLLEQRHTTPCFW